jgi:hypothetical protein
MTTELKELKGRIVGLEAIITSILGEHQNIQINEVAVGKLILERKLDGVNGFDDADIRRKARETMHEVTSIFEEGKRGK